LVLVALVVAAFKTMVVILFLVHLLQLVVVQAVRRVLLVEMAVLVVEVHTTTAPAQVLSVKEIMAALAAELMVQAVVVEQGR
jgi:hypothetical protein